MAISLAHSRSNYLGAIHATQLQALSCLCNFVLQFIARNCWQQVCVCDCSCWAADFGAVTITGNGGCTALQTEPCLANWPEIPMSMQFRLVWLTIFGFYLYEMIGTALR
jgi:hypothetical protein